MTKNSEMGVKMEKQLVEATCKTRKIIRDELRASQAKAEEIVEFYCRNIISGMQISKQLLRETGRHSHTDIQRQNTER